MNKVVELVSGGSVINVAYSSSFFSFIKILAVASANLLRLSQQVTLHRLAVR